MFFEDVEIGARRELGSYTFRDEDIIAFARRYDPQIFHLDAEAAKATVFGGLIASGWHTAAIWMKLMVADRQSAPDHAPAISPGFQDMRWLRPVRAGTTLRFSTEVTEKREWKARPSFGLVLSTNEAREANGALAMQFTGKVLLARKEAP